MELKYPFFIESTQYVFISLIMIKRTTVLYRYPKRSNLKDLTIRRISTKNTFLLFKITTANLKPKCSLQKQEGDF